jgi:Transposase
MIFLVVGRTLNGCPEEVPAGVAGSGDPVGEGVGPAVGPHRQGSGCVHPEALRNWVRQDEADRGERADQLSTAERGELKRLRAENTQLRRANEILKAASAIFAAGLDRPRTR